MSVADILVLVLQITAWSFPALFAVWALVVFVAWIVETIKAKGLFETIADGFSWLFILICAGGFFNLIVNVFFK